MNNKIMNNRVLSRPMLRRAVVTAALLLTATACAQARLEFYSARCEPPHAGNTWLVVATYDDHGHIAHLCGCNCLGWVWQKNCTWTIVGSTSNPTGGVHPDLDGGYGTVWSNGSWARLSIVDGLPTKVWGVDDEGMYWTTNDLSLD